MYLFADCETETRWCGSMRNFACALHNVWRMTDTRTTYVYNVCILNNIFIFATDYRSCSVNCCFPISLCKRKMKKKKRKENRTKKRTTEFQTRKIHFNKKERRTKQNATYELNWKSDVRVKSKFGYPKFTRTKILGHFSSFVCCCSVVLSRNFIFFLFCAFSTFVYTFHGMALLSCFFHFQYFYGTTSVYQFISLHDIYSVGVAGDASFFYSE